MRSPMQLERHDHVTLIRMDNGKANAVSRGWLDRFEGLLDALGDTRAVVLTGAGSAFSAGLDLPFLIDLDRAAMEAFIRRFDRAMLRVFALPRPVVAAINGHAIAGGCVLALQADWRVMAEGKGRIGLNEVQLGIGLPGVVLETARSQVPPASLLPVALEGQLFPPREAQELGLVHDVAPAEALVERALAKARQLASVPPAAFAQVKAALRRPAIDRAHASEDREVAAWLDTWFSADARARLRAVVDQIASAAR